MTNSVARLCIQANAVAIAAVALNEEIHEQARAKSFKKLDLQEKVLDLAHLVGRLQWTLTELEQK